MKASKAHARRAGPGNASGGWRHRHGWLQHEHAGGVQRGLVGLRLGHVGGHALSEGQRVRRGEELAARAHCLDGLQAEPQGRAQAALRMDAQRRSGVVGGACACAAFGGGRRQQGLPLEEAVGEQAAAGETGGGSK